MTVMGIGFYPVVSGTVGSLLGLFVVCILSFLNWQVYFVFTLLFCALSLWSVSIYLKIRPVMNTKHVVIDQVVGVLIGFFLVSANWVNLWLGFFLFRVFSSLKLSSRLFFNNKTDTGVGQMSDAILAGVLVNLIFHFILIYYLQV